MPPPPPNNITLITIVRGNASINQTNIGEKIYFD
jgi:hypothetical protein